MVKTIKISTLIVSLMFLLMPVDMLNGLLLKNNINLPLSIGQVYKTIILFLILFPLVFYPKKLILSFGLFLLLIFPSFVQVFIQSNVGFLLKDIIKVTRYLTPVYAFIFFVYYIKKGSDINLLFNLIKFSFIIFCANILLKYIGLGYPLYSYNNIGSKGFFYAGNETSVVLIILSSILGYKLWLEKKIRSYFLLFLFSVFIGVTISSKTGILGVFITFILIPLKSPTFKVSKTKLKFAFLSLLLICASFFLFLTDAVQNSPLFLRFNYFWGKLDFMTFVLSNRNNFVSRAFEIYYHSYSSLEKFIGVGQTKYETLNGDAIVEVDVADIFFAYGFIGLGLFMMLMLYMFSVAKFFKRQKNHPYSGLVYLMILILLGISIMAGHVFSSGMAAIFIGLLFSLTYIKDDQIEV